MTAEELEHNMDLTTKRLQKLAASNAPVGARITAENRHRDAYQLLVRAGLRTQLRGKYRGK